MSADGFLQGPNFRLCVQNGCETKQKHTSSSASCALARQVLGSNGIIPRALMALSPGLGRGSHYLSIYLSTYLSIYLPTYLSTYLPIYPSICASMHLPIYLARVHMGAVRDSLGSPFALPGDHLGVLCSPRRSLEKPLGGTGRSGIYQSIPRNPQGPPISQKGRPTDLPRDP